MSGDSREQLADDVAELPVTVTFGGVDHDLAHRMIGAMLDMTLTGHGASIDQLETVHLGLGEIVHAIATTGAIARTRMQDTATGPALMIEHSAPTVTFASGSREIADAAFADLVLGDHWMSMRTPLPAGGRVDD